MKVGILTLHSSYSYGACLQAYATYLAVQSSGHDVYMIDYVNTYEQEQNRIVSLKKGQGLSKSAKYTFENIFLRKSFNMRESFGQFHQNYKRTRRYYDVKELGKESFDCLVSGSDQLWNPDIFGGIDTAYFLNFGSDDCRRISYAASAGSHVFTEDEVKKIKPLLMRYDAISVRERTLKEQVDAITGEKSEIVLDPTFLITGDQWRNNSVYENKEEYILLYMIGVPYKEYKIKYAPVVSYFKEAMGLPVYAITPLSFIRYYGADRSLTTLTPNDLIGAIDNAAMIITSSFHGVAFSINLNKKFVALKTANPARVDNLLKMVNLTDRQIDGFDQMKCYSMLDEIDYSVPNRILDEQRMKSKNWLLEKIEGENRI